MCNVVPTLLGPTDPWPDWFPAGVAEADQVLLLVLDGLGWEQLTERPHLAPDPQRHGRAVPS